MTSSERTGFGPYLALTRLLCPLVPLALRWRLRKGKEMPGRWREKLGEASVSRPDGPLIWMHAVGLGEALALRALVAALEARRPELNILVTTGTRGSAEALAKNGIGGAIHQFLPMDCPKARAQFLDHWHPDFAVWSEQDIWPGLVHAAAERGIPQVWINARMNRAARDRRMRQARLYRAVYGCFQTISAQDDDTTRQIAAFGVTAQVDGSLKPAAQPLADNAQERDALTAAIGERRVWLAASSHPQDEAVALDALTHLAAPGLLVIAPRYPQRGDEIVADARARGLRVAQRSSGQRPDAQTQVYVADTLGEMGLWYRLAEAALIGGTNDDIEGHNPWEAAALDCAILHGPRVANFATDYAVLDAGGAARQVMDGAALAAALDDPLLSCQTGRASVLVQRGRDLVDALASQLLTRMDA